MSDQDDWDFAGADDAKAEIRAAVAYLLRGATGGARGDIVQEIIAIVRQVAGLPPEQPNPLDDGLPGGGCRHKTPIAGWPLHDSRKAAGESGIGGLERTGGVPLTNRAALATCAGRPGQLDKLRPRAVRVSRVRRA
jgi:hypothetical protein